MEKAQFYISFNEKGNTAAVKAIEDCKQVLSVNGYHDFSLTVTKRADKRYLAPMLQRLALLYFRITNNATVAIQYPLLSGNSIFKFFIKALRIKKVRIFCIVHDLDELRHRGRIPAGQDTNALNCYDCIIVHNEVMLNWLKSNGVVVPMISLGLFDYLPERKHVEVILQTDLKKIAFAGNLSKSEFIYELHKITDWSFNIYGPNFSAVKGYNIPNIHWHGSFSAGRILEKIEGAFGLIWDGDQVEELDSAAGNYLLYNNPHKLSLYIAAGLPVIVPRLSAVATFVLKNGIGFVINGLQDLKGITIEFSQYQMFKKNIALMGPKVTSGEFLNQAVGEAEKILIDNNKLKWQVNV
jgi:hypothetical protein